MEDKKYQYGSAIIQGKKVPFTKSGLPNQVYLSKLAKGKVQAFAEQRKNIKIAATEKELSDLFKTLVLK